MNGTTELQIDATDVAPASSKGCAKCGRRFGEAARFCPFDGEPVRNVHQVHSDPIVGCVVDGRYKVLSVLGEGGMGTVYRVVHRALQREFALKALRGDIASEPNLAERFLREARSAAAISHPNVCEITDFGYLPDGRPYFAMELLVGKPLSWWLGKGGPIPVGAAVRMIEQIATVLELAHVAGIVHRDLKPENIVVDDATSNPRVKVVDFGLAQVAGQSRLTRPGLVYGTPHYMSPEQASGGEVDHRADIYALGVVMYETFTGRVPFEADTYMGVLTKHMYMAPTPPSELVGASRDLGAIEDIVLRCLQKLPERRYQRMVDLVAALRTVVSFGDDGRTEVRPRRPREPENTRALPVLADELEPPTIAELQLGLARMSNSNPTPAWIWAAVVASVSVLLAAVVYAGYGGGSAESQPVAPHVGQPVVVSHEVAPSHPLPVVRPDRVIATASTAQSESAHSLPLRGTPSRQTKSRIEPPESPLESDEQPPPLPLGIDEQPEPTEPTQAKPDFGTGDIVDPWSD